MSIEKTTRLGKIKIHDGVFNQMLIGAMKLTNGKAFYASPNGKLLQASDKKVSQGDLSACLKTYVDSDYQYIFEFYIITEFGASISHITNIMLDYIESEFKLMQPDRDVKIICHIVGVKSKRVALRDIEVVREIIDEVI